MTDEIHKKRIENDENKIINDTKNEQDINESNKYNKKFFKNYVTKGVNMLKNVKECAETIKQDFVSDMKEHYNYVTTTYNQIKQSRLQNERDGRQTANNQDNTRFITTQEAIIIMDRNNQRQIQLNMTDPSNRLISRNENSQGEISQFLESFVDTMIQEHVRNQTEWLNELHQIKLTKEEYDKLIKTHIMTKGILQLHNINNNSCSICQEIVEIGQNCAITSCNHIYHSKCSIEWFINKCIKPTCPVCRKDVRETLENN